MKSLRLIKILCIAFLSLLCLTACSFPMASLMDKITDEEGELVSAKSEEIIACLTENNKEGLSELFSVSARSSKTFQDELDAVFGFFSSEVYLRSQAEALAGGSASIENGKKTRWEVSPEITYIEVLQKAEDSDELLNRYYSVRYHWVIEDDEHPDRKGITYLEVSLLNTERSASIGSE